MKNIPQNCIDTFKERFGSYPSVVDLLVTSVTPKDMDTFLSKSHLLWYEDWVNDEYMILHQGRLYEYDSTGIFIYRRLETDIFILTTVDKKNVVDYMISQLKRLTIKKD
jgi:hypothetical protein